jgi:hypothetical protein
LYGGLQKAAILAPFGRMEGGKGGRIRQFGNSTIRQLEEWNDGRMEECDNLIIGQFGNGRME